MHSLWMIAAGLSFALMGVFVKMAAPHFSAAELVLYRGLAQTATAWAVLARVGLPVRTPRLGMHVHRGVWGFVSLFMFFYAMTELPLATAMTLNYTSPIFLAVFLAWLAREHPGGRLVATVALGFAGAVLLLRPTLTPEQLWPALVGLASGATSAGAYWNVRRLVRAKEPEGRVVFYFGLSATLGALVWMVPQTWHPVTLDNVMLLVGVGAFGAAGQFAMTRAFGRGRALVTAVLSYSSIVFASGLGIALWGDILPFPAWLGIALIVAAGIIALQSGPDPRRDAMPQVTND
jgi:drug/metabolite transporter (DMT)-like permease